jgi:hypothetical protein
VIQAFGLQTPGALALLLSWIWHCNLASIVWGGELVALPDIGYGGQLALKNRLLIGLIPS